MVMEAETVKGMATASMSTLPISSQGGVVDDGISAMVPPSDEPPVLFRLIFNLPAISQASGSIGKEENVSF
jgi:hypothetical protein